jgi:hypothetical protein
MTREPGRFLCCALLATAAISAIARESWVGRASLPTDVPPAWQTYRSPDYGFTIDYPASIVFHPSHPDRNCDLTSVACFYFDGSEDVGAKGTNLSGASLSVNVLRDRRTEQDCERIDNPLQPLKTETINGRKFRYGVTVDGWTSHSKRIPTYRAFHQNVCFEIAVGVEKVSTGAFDPGAIKEFDSTRLDKLLDEMVHTFKFVGTVKDGPGWKVFFDSACGAVFEYPEGDTVRTTVEDSKARSESNEITCSQSFTHHGLDYTVAAKSNLLDKSKFEAWLKLSGYPDLSKATVMATSERSTEYKAEPYYYIFRPGIVFIFSVSDAEHRVIIPHDDRVFTHLLNSFKVY